MKRPAIIRALVGTLVGAVLGGCASAPVLDAGLVTRQASDPTAAYQTWLPLAEQGDAEAQVQLGDLYHHGEGVKQDYAEAARWYRRAAEQGNAAAQFKLGAAYEFGVGIAQDPMEAERWYAVAFGTWHALANQGNARAQVRLADLYFDGRGTAQDYGEAARWFRQAAGQGDATAQYRLSTLYTFGMGVPQSDAEAARWMREAAEQGMAVAQFDLAVDYHEGTGVPQDDVEAARWYRRAAEQGVPMAQSILGSWYERGRGVSRDVAQAARWYHRAKDQYQAGAEEALSRLVEPISTTFVARRGGAQVRFAPTTSSEVVASVPAGDKLRVTGKVIGLDWYAVNRQGTLLGYVVAGQVAAAPGLPAPTPDVINGRVIVLSGDALQVAGERVRLWGITAPPMSSWPYGAWAREVLTALAGEANWHCVVRGTAPATGELLAQCSFVTVPIYFGGPEWTALRELLGTLYDRTGDELDLGAAMLLAGWAVADRAITAADPVKDKAYELHEAAAAAAKRGLWRDWQP